MEYLTEDFGDFSDENRDELLHAVINETSERKISFEKPDFMDKISFDSLAITSYSDFILF